MRLLNEMKGISRIASIYSNIVFDAIEPYVNDMIDARVTDEIDLIVYPSIIQDNIVGYEDDFLDYPIQRMRINLKLTMKKIPPKHPQGFDTTGAMWPFGKQRSGLSYVTKKYDVNFSDKILDELSVIGDIKLDLGLVLDPKRFRLKEIPKLKLELMSLIMHELNHGYEYWLRYEDKIDSDMKIALSFLDLTKKGFTKKVFRELNRFLYYIYWSLPHEQNAKIQELYPYVLKYSPNELKGLLSYKNIEEMINFDSDKFYNELISLIPERDINKVTEKALKSFITTYKEQHEELGEVMDTAVLNKNNIKDIFKYYQKMINQAGENMRRKVLRLYALKLELNK